MSKYLDLYCAAKKWLGVPFRWHGHTKSGCDCIGLIVGILCEYGVISSEDLLMHEFCKYGHNVSRIGEQYVNDMMLKYFNKFDGTKLKNGLVFRMKDYNAPYHFCDLWGWTNHPRNKRSWMRFRANFDDNLRLKVQDMFVLC